MKYFSTRNCEKEYRFEYVFMKGLAEDGGLFIPKSIPKVNADELSKMTFNKLAFTIFRCYIDINEISDYDLEDIISKSFLNMPIFLQKFKDFSVLELFHGPTFSFKDVALQVVGNLFEYFCLKRNMTINIVGATSGDTGSAAINGVKGKKNINCFILYPRDKVSEIQRRQMTTIEESNVYNIEVNGNFDDCQNIVKELFLNKDNDRLNLAAVNSINWARIMVQIVYYFYAYFQLNKKDKVNFVVPTGNFGNILAGFYAKKMGLPIDKLLIATNNNSVLYRVINTGIYEKMELTETLSPAMDITVSSNFERLLWYLIQESNEFDICQKLSEYMTLLKKSGKFTLEKKYLDIMKDYFLSEKVNDMEIIKTIKFVYKEMNYIIDPHTAVGINAYLNTTTNLNTTNLNTTNLNTTNLNPTNTICIATAHPGKFYNTIQNTLNISDWFVPNKLKVLFEKEERYNSLECDVNKIQNFIKSKINV